MESIAKKSLVVVVLHFGIGVIVLLCCMGMNLKALPGYANLIMLFIGVAILYCMWVVVDYFRMPNDPIVISADRKSITLNKSINLSYEAIVGVEAKVARGKYGIAYPYGTVKVCTVLKDYKIKYIADCETVAEIIKKWRAEQEDTYVNRSEAL